MMIFTESLFWEDPLWVNKNGSVYATDAKGKEFEINQELVNKYLSKYGNGGRRWKTLGNTLGGAVLGTAAGIPISLGATDMMHAAGASPGATQAVALPLQLGMTIGGATLGLRRGLNSSFNDIVKARRSGEI